MDYQTIVTLVGLSVSTGSPGSQQDVHLNMLHTDTTNTKPIVIRRAFQIDCVECHNRTQPSVAEPIWVGERHGKG